MATYILLDENRKSFMGTDTFIWVDDRLSDDRKVEVAHTALQKMAAVRPSMVREAKYIARYKSTQYDYNTYQYSGKLIPIA